MALVFDVRPFVIGSRHHEDTYRRRYAAIPLESTPPLRDLETMVYNDA